jgi:uncharacterized delta-60 repeat protein
MKRGDESFPFFIYGDIYLLKYNMSSVYCSTCDGTQESWVNIGDLPFNYPSLTPNDSFIVGNGFDDITLSTVIQSDGKILVGGAFRQYSGVSYNKIIRLNTDGSIDESFVIGDGFNDVVRPIELQPDGKILVGGRFTEYSGVSSNYIIRLNSDGSIDSSFDIGTGFNSFVSTIALQTDGKILVGGEYNEYSGVSSNYIIRLNSDGSIDSSFDIGTGFNASVSTIALQTDGKILVGGAYNEYSGVSSDRIIRLNTDASVDNSFVIGTGFNGNVYTIALQPDGKILVGGDFTSYSGVSRNFIIRLNTNGSIDTSFVIGTGFDGGVYSLKILSDGKIAVVGGFIGYDGTTSPGIVLLNNDGSLLNLYIGFGFNGSILIISETNNGNILVGGEFTQFNGTNSNFIIMLDINLSLSSYRTTNQLCVYPISGFTYNGNLVFDAFNNQILNSYVNTIQIQPDGKALVGGAFTNYIIRLFPDGSIDNTFNVGSGFNNYVRKIKLLDNGKILVGGQFTSYNGYSSNYIARLNSDGSFDTTFDIGTGFNNDLNDIEVLSDGRILCGGRFTTFDLLFIIGAGFNGSVSTIQIQTDGKILVGGPFTSYSGVSRNYIVRLNTDGSVDTSFVIGNGFNASVLTIALQSDGKILVGGQFTSYSGVSRNNIIRLNTNGSIDNSFVIGTGFNSSVSEIALQSDGKILVGGPFTSYSGVSRNRIIRLNTDGSVDTGFVIGTGFTTSVSTIALQSDGKILVGGQFTSYSGVSRNRIIRLNADGSIDTSFVIGTGFNLNVNTIELQSDGKILVGGGFTSYSGVSRNYIIRLNTDGSVDTSFVIGFGFNNITLSIALQPDGKILVGGNFNSYNGVSRNFIIRLNTNGSVDTSFVIDTGFNSFVNTIALQSDGKILVGGNFTSYSDYPSSRIIRLNTDGSIDGDICNRLALLTENGEFDNSFVIGTGFTDNVQTIQIQSDGKILVGGDFTSYSGVSRNRIIRLNADGSIDTSFVIGTGFGGNVNAIALQPDGKILVGGIFTSYSGVSRNYIIRLNTDGSVDTSFVIGTGFNGTVQSIEIQSDSKILVGGNYTSYSGVSINYIIRLNTNGSIDYSFDIGTGFNQVVQTIEIQTDGKILVGGYFTTFDFISRYYIAELYSEGTTPIELSSFFEFSSCTECFNFIINSGNEYLMCEVCSGDTFTVTPPHPVWTNNYGTAVTMLDAIVLGGPNGLNN